MNCMVLVPFGDDGPYPPAMMPRVFDAAPPFPLPGDSANKSPKSTAFPVVAIVINSI